uniref:U6 snRNA-associated Sm-like protein LSm8 n=1 Tax=Canis lupus familiaris TaxID=9615 RepID=A0A8I3NA72_CANLF
MRAGPRALEAAPRPLPGAAAHACWCPGRWRRPRGLSREQPRMRAGPHALEAAPRLRPRHRFTSAASPPGPWGRPPRVVPPPRTRASQQHASLPLLGVKTAGFASSARDFSLVAALGPSLSHRLLPTPPSGSRLLPSARRSLWSPAGNAAEARCARALSPPPRVVGRAPSGSGARRPRRGQSRDSWWAGGAAGAWRAFPAAASPGWLCGAARRPEHHDVRPGELHQPNRGSDHFRWKDDRGTLKGFDQTINLILDESHERVFSSSQGVEQVVLGLYIVRGDNVAVIGEIDEETDSALDLGNIRAEPLNSVAH